MPNCWHASKKHVKSLLARTSYNYLDRAVYSEFRGLVVIDEARVELHRVLSKINANISVLEFKAFITDGGERSFQFDTLYDEFDDSPVSDSTGPAKWKTSEERAARQTRR